MYYYSKTSAERLSTCHKDLQTIFNEVIKYFDCTILCGHRTTEEQQNLYKQGRTTGGKIITYVDGINVLGKHNYSPSLAVDAVAYPIDWDHDRRNYLFVGFVLGMAKMLYQQGRVSHKLRSGVDWDQDWDLDDQRLIDVPHFELIT